MVETTRPIKGPSLPVKITATDFRTRLELAKPEDTARGMFFNGVLDAVDKLLPAPARAMCLEASGEKRFVDFLSYPIASFLHLSYTAAELLAPKVGGIPQAFRKLGTQAGSDFLSSGVGRTLLVLVSDPERMVAAVPSAFKTAVSYGERTVEQKQKGRSVISMKRDFMPHPYHEGVLFAAMTAVGAKNVQVSGSSVGELDTRYEISWDAKPA